MDIKKQNLKIIAIIIILVTVAYLYFNKSEEIYTFEGNKFHYSKDRGKPEYEIELLRTNDSIDLYKVNFPSRNFLNFSTRIYGLVFIPHDEKNLPGVVLLPGGGGTKEGESRLAMIIAKMGYAVITIDQRGIGETGGYYLGVEQDYGIFVQGNEPIQHLSDYDIFISYFASQNEELAWIIG